MSFWSILVAIAAYLLRHWDPAGIHKDENPIEKAAAKIVADAKAAADKAILDKFQASTSPPAPPAPPAA